MLGRALREERECGSGSAQLSTSPRERGDPAHHVSSPHLPLAGSPRPPPQETPTPTAPSDGTGPTADRPCRPWLHVPRARTPGAAASPLPSPSSSRPPEGHPQEGRRRRRAAARPSIKRGRPILSARRHLLVAGAIYACLPFLPLISTFFIR